MPLCYVISTPPPLNRRNSQTTTYPSLLAEAQRKSRVISCRVMSALQKPSWRGRGYELEPNLLVILVGLVVNDVEEAQLVHALGGRHDAQPVAQLLLLEELLGAVHIAISHFAPHITSECRSNVQVLQVATGELLVRNHLDLAISLLANDNGVAKVASAALDLDAVVEELLEGLDVEDLVVDGLAAVDDELLRHLGGLALLGCL